MTEQEIQNEEMRKAAIAEIILSDAFLVFTINDNVANYYKIGDPRQCMSSLITAMINNNQIARFIDIATKNYHYDLVKQGLKAREEEE